MVMEDEGQVEGQCQVTFWDKVTVRLVIRIRVRVEFSTSSEKDKGEGQATRNVSVRNKVKVTFRV